MDSLLHVLGKGLSLTDKLINDVYQGGNHRDVYQGGNHRDVYQGGNHQQRRYAGKDYITLKRECLSSRSLFTDHEFPASSTNLLNRDNLRRVEWKRPHEICQRPRFFVDGASRFDLTQGEIGDCWLIATIANITLNKDIFNQVIPPGQDFDGSYAGIFYFRFWCFGQWREVVVDDKLPTYNGKLIYARSDDRNEFWPSLLEKAYAKLQGSYEALDGGITSDAMVHFTGGVTEMIELRNYHSNLFELMNKGIEKGSLLSASISGSKRVKEQKLTNGLIRGHAYSITNVSWCNLANRPGKPVQLIRMRNPWGNDAEWKGAWSDRSREWSSVSSEEKKVLGIQFKNDGEFWMSFEDFKRNFDHLEMTNVNLQSLKEHDSRGRLKHMWKVKHFEGSWIKGSSAGGCANYTRTFPNNPKFFITLTEEDDGDKDHSCTMIVALLQRPRNAKHIGAHSSHPIGFSLFRVSSKVDVNNLDKNFFKRVDEVDGLRDCTVCSQISHRFNLPVGNYCLIPTTMYPDEEADFIVRIFTEKSPDIRDTFAQFRLHSASNTETNIPASAPYPPQQTLNDHTGAPYPPSTVNPPMSKPYHPQQTLNDHTGAPYPPSTVNPPMSTPYPPQQTLNDQTGAPYPPSTVNPPMSTPYPPQQTLHDQTGAPYPPSTVNPPMSIPYPPSPLQPMNAPMGAPYPPSTLYPANASMGAPYPPIPLQPAYSPVAAPYPPSPLQPAYAPMGGPYPPSPLQPTYALMGAPYPPNPLQAANAPMTAPYPPNPLQTVNAPMDAPYPPNPLKSVDAAMGSPYPLTQGNSPSSRLH